MFGTVHAYSHPSIQPPTRFHPSTRSHTITAQLWSFFGGPMLFATDVRNMSAFRASIVLNSDLLAINADMTQPIAVRVSGNATTLQLWTKALANGDLGVVLYNANDNDPAVAAVAWSDVGWAGASVSI
jgi:hypothetical protein